MFRSPGRFAKLLSADWSPGAAGALDEGEFRDACAFALRCWQVLPILGPRVLALGGDRLAESTAAKALRDALVAVRTYSSLQLALAERVTGALDGAGIPYALLKGSAARYLAYRSPEERCGIDLDIAVQKEALHRAEVLVNDLGFLPAEWNVHTKRFVFGEPSRRHRLLTDHHELGFLVRRQRVTGLGEAEGAAIRRQVPGQGQWHVLEDGDLGCYVSVDIHHGLSVDIGAEPLLASTKPFSRDGYSSRVPSMAWLLFHLVFKTYWEGVHNYGKGGYQFADLVRLLPRVSEVEFQQFTELLARYRMQPAGFYVLARLNSEFGLSLRADHASFIEHQRSPDREMDPVNANDLGDMWNRVWGHR